VARTYGFMIVHKRVSIRSFKPEAKSSKRTRCHEEAFRNGFRTSLCMRLISTSQADQIGLLSGPIVVAAIGDTHHHL